MTTRSRKSSKSSSAGRPLSFVGIGDSGRRDVAERHEDLLWKPLESHPGKAQGSRERFLELARRFTESSDPIVSERLRKRLARLIFGE